MKITIDPSIAIIVAAGIAVFGNVVTTIINKRASQAATHTSPRRKRRIPRWVPTFVSVVSIGASISALVVLGMSGAPVTRSFVVLATGMAALLVVSVALFIAVFIVATTIRRDVAAVGDLVIHSARYGARDMDTDATEAVRSKIKNGRIDVPVCNALVGSDPCKGVTKALKVDYTYAGREQAITVKEDEILTLPLA